MATYEFVCAEHGSLTITMPMAEAKGWPTRRLRTMHPAAPR